MTKRRTTLRWSLARVGAVLVGLSLVLSVNLPGVAFAQGAGAGNSLQEDVVDEINVSRRTLVIAGETYQVASSARIMDSEGRSISLAEIRATLNNGEGDLVEYSLSGSGTSSSGSGLREIGTIQVLGGDYE